MQEARLSDAFAEVVKNHREAKGMSKAVLAERAGLHQTYIGLLERKKSHASLDSANSLAEGLGVPLEKLISEAKVIHQSAKRKK